ncbi:MAG: prolyl oligopeptidase family serine peptidase [Clostridia bacterium]|nr:prolyl oligopeptidase family serine peptidase [Clostridia bacterium]
MKKLITYDTIRSFCYTNDALIEGPVRGIVLDFFGLGNTNMFFEDTDAGRTWAEKNILLVVPYNNPWAWMNPQAIETTDEILDVLFEKLALPEGTPIVSTGGSMGGMSAITYMAYAKRTPVACVANCPVCDLPYHFTERPDLPRTLYSAFYHEDGAIGDVLPRFSPLHLVGKLPRVPYFIFHCEEDKAVNIAKHSERFVAAMEQAGYDVTLTRVPERGHCNLTDEAWDAYRAAAAGEIARNG